MSAPRVTRYTRPTEREAGAQALREHVHGLIVEEQTTAEAQFTGMMQEERQRAVSEFETSLEQEKAAAWRSFEAEMQIAKQQFRGSTSREWNEYAQAQTEQFLEQLDKQEQTARAQFDRDWQTLATDAEREYIQSLRAQGVPWRQRNIELEQFREMMAIERGVHEATMAAQLQDWRTRQMGILELTLKQGEQQFRRGAVEQFQTWETSQRTVFERQVVTPWFQEAKEAFYGQRTVAKHRFFRETGTLGILGTWEQEARTSFETHLASWKAEQLTTLETSILPEFHKTWQPKGLGERLAGVTITSPFGAALEAVGVQQLPALKGGVVTIAKPSEIFQVKPLGMVGGLVASAESLVYGVTKLGGTLVGVDVPTPRIPPTLAGGLVTSAITRQPSRQLQEAQELGFGYALGTAVGDVLLAYGISKGVQAIDVRIGSPLARTETWIARKLTKPLVGTRLDQWLYGRSGYWRALHPVTGKHYVAVPTIQTKAGEHILSGQLDEISARFIYPLMEQPRTSALILSKTPGITAPLKAKPTLFAVTGLVAEMLPPLGEPARIRPATREPLSFERYRWQLPGTRALGFTKGKLPTRGALARETRGSTSLTQLLTTPVSLPKLGVLTGAVPFAGPRASIFGSVLGAAILGITPRLDQPFQTTIMPTPKKAVRAPTTRPKALVRPSIILQDPRTISGPLPLQRQQPKRFTFPAPIIKATTTLEELVLLPKATVAQKTKVTTAPISTVSQISDVILAPPMFAPPILAPRKEPPKRKKRKVKPRKKEKRKRRGLERYGLVYPVATTSQVAKWILGPKKKNRR